MTEESKASAKSAGPRGADAAADAATELSREHGEIERLTDRIATLEMSSERAGLVREVSARFLAHGAAERRYLYPVLRRYLPRGSTEAVELGRRQEALARIVESIERTDEFDATADALVGQLVVDIRRHIERQDRVLLPALAESCPPEENDRLGRQLRSGLREARAEATRGTEHLIAEGRG